MCNQAEEVDSGLRYRRSGTENNDKIAPTIINASERPIMTIVAETNTVINAL